MDRKTILFILLFTFVFGGVVAYKLFFASKPVAIGREFALQTSEMITLNTEDKTKVKLVSINPVDGCTEDGVCNGQIEYTLIVNGEESVISSIPDSIDMYNAYELIVVDGDEDHIVLKAQRK